MKTTAKQQELTSLIDRNLQNYAIQMHKLNQYQDSYSAQSFAQHIHELVSVLDDTQYYAQELEEESYKVAEKEAGQYA